MTDLAENIAAAVLYEGYILWPYRRSAKKNRQRWSLGGVYPQAYSEACQGSDPWLMQTQCLVVGDEPTIAVKVRFLHVVERRVARQDATGTLEFVDALQVGGQQYLAWEEATEREISIEGLRLSALGTPRRVTIEIPAGKVEELVTAPDGEAVGALVRSWQALQGAVEVMAAAVQAGLWQLTVRITNTAAWSGQDRGSALKQTFVSTHTLLRVDAGAFISLMDPPEVLKAAATACENLKTWPVLVGEEGDRHTMLSSPIILYDYPRIAPESPGDLFDGTEIDQLLTLNILALTDEEKAEMRASDPRARQILERTESLSAADFMHLHGVIRQFQRLREAPAISPLWEELERPAPQQVVVRGVEIGKGSPVRLRPRAGGDILDLALAGKVAFVEAIEQDYEGRIQLAVTLKDDPGRDLGRARQPGHCFFFAPDEVEPLDADRQRGP